MGIFDNLANLSPEQTQGLLALASSALQAGGSGRPVSFGGALGGGIQAFQQSMDMQKKLKMEQEQAAQLAQLRGLDIQQQTGQIQQQGMARDQQTAIDQAAQGAVINGQFDQDAFLQNVQKISPLRAMEYAQKLAKSGPEFDTKPQTAVGPDGKPFQYILAKNGEMKRLDGVLPREELKLANLGGRDVAYNPFALKEGQSFQRTQTPDSVASNAVSIRGQNMADARAQETIGQGKIPQGYRMQADGSMVAIPGGPADPSSSKEGLQRVKDANDVLGILDQAEPLLKDATNSYLGVGADLAARSIGLSTAGAKASAKLKVLQGALVSKMPKMSGPQSDKDVQLYREMAGQIGDATIPAEQRLAAIQEVRALNEKYAGQASAAPSQRQQPARRSVLKGQVIDGYRFKGGDPAQQSNWEKQ